MGAPSAIGKVGTTIGASEKILNFLSKPFIIGGISSGTSTLVGESLETMTGTNKRGIEQIGLDVLSESSEKIYLEVYEGSSGPAIGGLNNAESLQAAETLKKLIEESEEVADYQYEGYYLDLDSKITMGIKDGVPYYNEEFCEESPDFQ